MVEVHVCQEYVVHLVARNPELVERSQQPRCRRGGTGIHECRATVVHDQVTRG
jgi:hypothetical protein